jgi:hypothetical protein
MSFKILDFVWMVNSVDSIKILNTTNPKINFVGLDFVFCNYHNIVTVCSKGFPSNKTSIQTAIGGFMNLK